MGRLGNGGRSAVARKSVDGADAGARLAAVGGSDVTLDVGDTSVGGMSLAYLVSGADETAGPRSKRALILHEAARRFGESGYEATKWSTVAGEVGIGQTALYHYFESKAHCLLTIMRVELARSHERFVRVVAEGGEPREALRRALEGSFAVSPPEVLQLRIVMANSDVLANQRATEREESERRHCLALTHAIESSWTDLVAQVTEQAPPSTEVDPRLAAQAVLGLINSVWRWYRPGGRLTLEEIASYYVAAAERVLI